MRFISIRTVSLLAILAFASGLWAVQALFPAPNDPLYAPACANAPGPCTVPPGQWDLRSDVRTQPPTSHPSGISVDLVWQTLSVGRPDVVSVVFDTGVNYDHVDLRNQIWLNRGELPAPNAACPARNPNDAHDCDGDGIFNF